MKEIPLYGVKRHESSAVTQVNVTVNGRSTNVEAHVPFFDRGKGFFLSTQRIENFQ
jgi:hypothetical protein